MKVFRRGFSPTEFHIENRRCPSPTDGLSLRPPPSTPLGIPVPLRSSRRRPFATRSVAKRTLDPIRDMGTKHITDSASQTRTAVTARRASPTTSSSRTKPP